MLRSALARSRLKIYPKFNLDMFWKWITCSCTIMILQDISQYVFENNSWNRKWIKYSNANLQVVFALLCTSLSRSAIYLVSWPQHLLQFFFWHFVKLKLEKLESIGTIYSTSDWFFMEHDLTSYRKRILMFGKLMSPSKGQIISEEKCSVLNFPEKRLNYFKDFCPSL